MKSSVAALVGGASTVLAATKGWNYAAQEQDYNGFLSSFKTAQSLTGAEDFNSARLYTMIQHGSTNTPIEAIQAAIDSNTTLLLGLWASSDQATFDNEITALKAAIQQYGEEFANLVVGISVGSEDLYRISPTGIAAGSNPGQSPDVLVEYISQTRDAIKGTSLGNAKVGHVDTWNVYVNSSNNAVISACDWLGLDEYPYFQTTDDNTIDNAGALFFEAYDKVATVSGGKPIWITEAGWPVSGPNSNLAVANVDNAEEFWQDVACELECRNVPFWWYILDDAGATPSFGVSEGGKPLYNLACNSHKCGDIGSGSASNGTSSASGNSTAHSNSTASATGVSRPTSLATATATGSGASATGSGSGSATATATGANGSPSAFPGAAPRVTGSIASIVMAGVVAAFFL